MLDRLDGNENIWNEDDLEDSVKKFFKLKNKDIEEKSIRNREIYLSKYSLNKIKSNYLSTVNNLLYA